MTITKMHEWFDFMVDKFDSPYYTDDEKDLVINRAQLDYVNNFAIAVDDDSVAEVSQDWEQTLYPLIDMSVPVTTNTAGVVLLSDIEAALSTPLVKVLAVRDSVTSQEVKFVRHNDYGKLNRNFFSKPSNDYKVFRIGDNGLNIRPKGSGKSYGIVTLREPIEVDLGGAVDCELPSFTHNKIVAKAIAMAGIATEEQASAALDSFTDKK